MKVYELDRIAYNWACRLLPDHIEKLKKELEEDDGKTANSFYLAGRIANLEDDLAEITKRYDKLVSKE